MEFLNEFVLSLFKYLIGETHEKISLRDQTLIKFHTRALEELGDVSFPLPIKNWYSFVGDGQYSTSDIIFCYKLKETPQNGLKLLQNQLKFMCVEVEKYKIIKNGAHLFLRRAPMLRQGITDVLEQGESYGKCNMFNKQINVIVDSKIVSTPLNELDLTLLRVLIIKKVAENMLKMTAYLKGCSDKINVPVSSKMYEGNTSCVLCGPVLNERGVKETDKVAQEFFSKRASDMQLMAQHRYRLNVKSTAEWDKYFLNLGIASVKIEMLTNKPQKSVKVALHDLSGPNKGSSFIFYNCARLSVILHDFQKRVTTGIYPPLPHYSNIDFNLLNQPEEWELFYVYILQYPHMIRNCIRSIECAVFNPQHVIIFLSNLSSVFSVYYRRVRILTEPRDHLAGTLHARIYLLKCLQQVFHNALRILDIDPIKEM